MAVMPLISLLLQYKYKADVKRLANAASPSTLTLLNYVT